MTEKLGDVKLGSFIKIEPISYKKLEDLKEKIDSCNTTVEIDAKISESGLQNVAKLSTHIKELKAQGKLNELGVNDVNNRIQTQNYTNIADQAFGFSGVNTAIKEYNRIIGDNTENQTKFLEVMGKTNPKLAECMKLHTDGSMGLKDYGKYLATATLKTIGLEAATMALNMAIGAGVGIKYIL